MGGKEAAKALTEALAIHFPALGMKLSTAIKLMKSEQMFSFLADKNQEEHDAFVHAVITHLGEVNNAWTDEDLNSMRLPPNVNLNETHLLEAFDHGKRVLEGGKISTVKKSGKILEFRKK